MKTVHGPVHGGRHFRIRMPGSAAPPVPCMGVTSHLLTSVPEIERHVAPHGELGAFLATRFKEMRGDHCGWSRVQWDVATVAWLLDPSWVPSELVLRPLLTDQCTWSVDRRRHPIRCASFVHRDRHSATCSASSPPPAPDSLGRPRCAWSRCALLPFTGMVYCAWTAECATKPVRRLGPESNHYA